MSEQQDLWNSFLSRWPREKLRDLTLKQYVSVNDDDTFTYWLETKTRELGSIQGNTSAKFGIYKRNSAGKEQSGIGHGDIYTWRTRYGNNESEAFNYVKDVLIQVAQAAYEGDLNKIDHIDFAPLVKWKIAFLYQNQEKPVLINTFSKPMLEVLTGSNNKVSFPHMYQQLIFDKGEQDLLKFGDTCWKEAEQKRKEIQQRSIFDQFSHVELFNRGLELWPLETINAFCSLISEANNNKLDVFTTSMSTGAMIRIGRKELGAAKAEEVFATFEPTLKKINFVLRYEHRDGYECSEVSEDLYQRIRKYKKLAQFAKQYSITRKAHWPKSYLDDDDTNFEIAELKESYTMLKQSPLNQILYGPPGTGKTYHTIEAAVKAAEPEYYASLNINPEYGANNEQRKLLQDKYLELSKGNRIRFVTFHQSYGYEEFVEGLRAVSNEYNQVEYSIKSGVFKQLCQAASSNGALQSNQINSEPRIWKISIDGTKVSQIRTYCFANNLAAIGWGETGDMSSEERTEEEHIYFDSLGTQSKSSVFEFTNRMMKGDIVVCVKGQWSIQAVGVVSGDYQYRPDGLLDRPDFCHFMPVNWLATDLDVELYSLNDNTRLTLKTCYELDRFTQAELFEHLNKNDIDLADYSNSQDPVRNYVLVIDEINRGNISKIFGELITLIEPSKRKPNTKDDEIDESITLTLPYSGKPFSVPDNLHIIGTMNTADRSLAMMDTALRRRFDFIEMMPKTELLANTVVDGIDLEKLLTVLNERIEILYDREHTLGHAFFMPVKALVDVGEQEKAFSALVSVFQNKIIPLLEEYFFEDWDKIRLVLADNQKEETLQFVSEKSLDNSKLSALFGKKHGLNQYGETQKQYILKNKSDGVWKDAQAYKDIYATSDKQGE